MLRMGLKNLITFLKSKNYSIRELSKLSPEELADLINKYVPEMNEGLKVYVGQIHWAKSFTKPLAEIAHIEKNFNYKGKTLNTATWETWCRYVRTPENLWDIYTSEHQYILSDNARKTLLSSVTSRDVAYFLHRACNDDNLISARRIHYIGLARYFMANGTQVESELILPYAERIAEIVKEEMNTSRYALAISAKDAVYSAGRVLSLAASIDPMVALKATPIIKSVEEDIFENDFTTTRTVFSNERSSVENFERDIVNEKFNILRWEHYKYVPKYKDLFNYIVAFGRGERLKGYPTRNFVRRTLLVK